MLGCLPRDSGANPDMGVMLIIPIEDGNSNFQIVELRKGVGTKRKTPHCKNHGAMLKVGPGIPAILRCVQAKGTKDCRAGCSQIGV